MAKTSKKEIDSAGSSSVPHVLYRKYRPTKLEDVVGQEQITNTLANSIKQGKIGHAYLFIGPRGTGKTSVARIFAHAVNDLPYSVEDNYLDIIEIDAASNTGVDNIRELREKAVIAPSSAKYKVYIIDEVHMLSKSAANALLKTIEEPPEHVIFIMATTEANKVPITISSRTQLHIFQLASPETMLQHLRKISDLEHIDIEDDALKIIVRRGGGSFRDSLSLLDQVVTLTDKTITADLLNSALGLPQDEIIAQLINSYQTGDLAAIQSQLETLLNTGLSAETIASELIRKIINESILSALPLLDKLTGIQSPFADAKLLVALASATSAPKPSISIAQPTPASTKAAAAKQKTVKTPAVPEAPDVPKTPETPEVPEAQKAPDIPAAPPQPAQPQVSAPNASQPFAWDNLLSSIKESNSAICLQLQKCDHEFDGATLHIYPTQKFTVKFLKKAENSQALVNHLNGISLIVHELEDRVVPKDESLSQISAIMGDVREIKGDMPF